jgi:hypothetical protein
MGRDSPLRSWNENRNVVALVYDDGAIRPGTDYREGA